VDEKRSVLEHIEELRARLIRILVFFTGFAVIGFILSPRLISYFTDLFPADLGVRLVVSHPMDFLLTQVNIAIFTGFLLSTPAIIYEVFSFSRPAFHRKERKLFACIVVSSTGLFLLGLVFGYFILLRFTLWFLAGLSYSAGVLNLWNLNMFVSFVFLLCMVMGLVFLAPVLVLVLVKSGIIDLDFLKDNRAYVVIGIFILAAMITPPDPFSQVIVALPMILLYEASILIARVLERSAKHL